MKKQALYGIQRESKLERGSGSDADLAEVLAGWRGHDRQTQQRLYDVCHQKVFPLTVRMVGLQDAPDITWQVFLRVLRKIDQFAGQAEFDMWLYRVAVNEGLQHLRRRSRHEPQPLLCERMSRHRSEDERQETRESLDRALALLEPELRSVFLLREVEELSYGGIGVAVEIPEGTVGSRLNRARRELRQHLTDLGCEP